MNSTTHEPVKTKKKPAPVLRFIGLLYGFSAFAVAVAIWPFMVIFMGNLRYVADPWLNPSVDAGHSLGSWTAVLINIFLLLLFGLQHSLMSRNFVKQAIEKIVPKDLERSTYVHAANIAMILLLVFWQPLPYILWDLGSGILADIMWGLFGLGWLILLAGGTSIDLLELWGLRQAISWFKGEPYRELPMKTAWLYERVRHPQYLGILIGVWTGPYMTVGHILFALGFSLYIMIGLRYEERGIIERYGKGYEDYRQRVPALIPKLRK